MRVDAMTKGQGRILLALLLLACGAVAAWGMAMSDGEPAAGERHSTIRLMVDGDHGHDTLVLDDLQTLAVGESRSFTTESGNPGTVTRDAEGFAVEVDGKTLRIADHFSEEAGEGNLVLRKRQIELNGGEGEGRTLVFRSGDAAEPGRVKIVRRLDGDGSSFSWTSGDGALPPLPFSIDATIERLRGSARFQALDAATQEQVIQALRETAPKTKVMTATGEPGEKTIVLEVEDHEE